VADRARAAARRLLPWTAPWLGALALAGGCLRYQPAPVDPAGEVAGYRARSLADAGLGRYLDSLSPAPPEGRRWQPGDLALAALYFRTASLRQAREVEAARVAELAAGARPQPGLELPLEIDFAGRDGSEPWGAALSAVVPLETGGKRSARQARARAASLVALAQAMAERWELAQTVREAAFRVAAARGRGEAARAEAMALDSAAGIVERRFRDGAVSAQEWARLRSESRQATARLAEARRGEAEAWAALARVMGLPESALEPVRRSPDNLRAAPSACHLLGSAPRDSLGLVAVTRRWEVRRAAAEYLVTEGEVRVAVAQSWPDLALGSGLFLDHGVGKWLVSFAVPALPLDRNRARVREAEARRRVAAARLREAQEDVLAELDQALARCAAVHGGLEQAGRADSALAEEQRLADAAYRRGETGRTELALLAVARARSQSLLLEARLAEEEAGLAAERALGTWLAVPPPVWPEPQAAPPEGGR
jgi:outer membrane protein TolC